MFIQRNTIKVGAALVALALCLPASNALGTETYRDMCSKFVHGETGKGKTATLENPLKIWAILSRGLKPEMSYVSRQGHIRAGAIAVLTI